MLFSCGGISSFFLQDLSIAWHETIDRLNAFLNQLGKLLAIQKEGMNISFLNAIGLLDAKSGKSSDIFYPLNIDESFQELFHSFCGQSQPR